MRDPGALLERLSQTSRFRRASKGLERFRFEEETTSGLARQFPALYRKSAARFGLELGKVWEATFTARIEWMLRHEVARCFTCRKKDGTLLGIMIYVLSPAQKTAHGWMLAYDLSLGEKDFLRPLYLNTLQHLSGTVVHVDIADGIRPAIYDFKDSLGTESTPYFVVESPRSEACRQVFNTYRRMRRLLARSSH